MSRHLSERDWLSPTYEAPRFHEAEGDEDECLCAYCGDPGADTEVGYPIVGVHAECEDAYRREKYPEDYE